MGLRGRGVQRCGGGVQRCGGGVQRCGGGVLANLCALHIWIDDGGKKR